MGKEINLDGFRLAKALNQKYHNQLKLNKAHFRGGLGGVSLISLDSKTPELGFVNVTENNASKKIEDLSMLSPPGRPTPEKSLQSWILDKVLFAEPPAFWMDFSLNLITSEMRVREGGKNVVNDILAVDDNGALWVVELKSDRHLTRLIEQCENFEKVIRAHKDLFIELVEINFEDKDGVFWDGKTIKKMIVWPRLESSRGTSRSMETRKKVEENDIVEVAYSEVVDGYNFEVCD